MNRVCRGSSYVKLTFPKWVILKLGNAMEKVMDSPFHHVFPHYPLVICYIAIENGPVEILDFPMKNGGSVHSYGTVYQRVPLVNLQKAIENGPVEIVDFPIKTGDFPWQNVSSPEGNMTGGSPRSCRGPWFYAASIWSPAAIKSCHQTWLAGKFQNSMEFLYIPYITYNLNKPCHNIT